MFGFGSGVIKGKGNGTDDAIKMGLQKGAYVMPADSTEQIGAAQLGMLGKDAVPANVSNGEYYLPPEQVHGLGVQMLETMKNATHKPVPDKQGLGFGGVYLANGGVVDEEKPKKDWFKHTNAHIKKMGHELAEYSAKGDTTGKMGARVRDTAGTLGNLWVDGASASLDAGAAAVEGWEQGSRQAGANNSVSGVGGFGLGHAQPITSDSAGGRFFKGLFGLGDKPKLLGFSDKPILGLSLNNEPSQQPAAKSTAAPQQQEQKSVAATHQAVSTPPNTQPSRNVERSTMPAVTMSPQELYPRDYLGQVRSMSDGNQASSSQPKGYLVGDSKGVSFAPNQAIQGGFAGVAQQSQERPFVATIGETPDPRQSAAWKAASTPHAGAQNRQLTANQLNAMRGMLADEERNQVGLQQTAMNNATQTANNQANNQAALQREAMQQQGALMRDGLNQAGQNKRFEMQQAQQQGQFDASQAFSTRKQANQEQLDAIKIEQVKRLHNLQNALLSANSDTDRSAIAQQIAMLNGEFKQSDGFNPNQYSKLKRTTMGDDGLPLEQEDIVDLKTGQSILGGESAGKQRVGVTPDGKTVYVKDGKYFVE